MELYAVSDLHLGPGSDKAHYSSKWKNHQSTIRENWDKRIPQQSIVFMPGDFSWHQTPEDLYYDYYWIHHRPGMLKIMSPGNHDYGVWTSQENVGQFCGDLSSLLPLVGHAVRIQNPYDSKAPGIVVCGCRGTQSPGDKYFDTNSGASAKSQEKESVLYVREIARLALALKKAQSLRKKGDALVAMIHYPPLLHENQESVYSKLLKKFNVNLCLYGHLHQEAQWMSTFQGEKDGIQYRFVGTDFLDFETTHLGTFDKDGMHILPAERKTSIEWISEENVSSTSYAPTYKGNYYYNS